MAFRIVRNDITKVKADAIVNTANPEPTYAEGTDRAVYEAAGAEYLLAERERIGKLNVGQAAPTPAFALPAKYVIHTVGPEWIDGTHGEAEALRTCYQSCLDVALELDCQSVSFPLIATGVCGFPRPEALKIAVTVISEFLKEHEMKIILVVYDSEAFVLSGDVFADVDAYVNERMAAGEAPEVLEKPGAELPEEGRPPKGMAWQDAILWWIEKKGFTETEVYRRANVGAATFENVKNRTTQDPKKMTVAAFVFALRLCPTEGLDLMKRSGFRISYINKFDLIISYFLEHEIYDIFTINLTLFDHRQPLLGE